MSLSAAYTSVRALETIENYAQADTPLTEPPEELHLLASRPKIPQLETELECDMDGRFWAQALRVPDAIWDVEFWLPTMVVSDWTARVPGLYWSEAARATRGKADAMVEDVIFRGGKWYPYPDYFGLYLSENSSELRSLVASRDEAAEFQSNAWTMYTPVGKSSKVLGGVGTLKFPPAESGIRLVTLSGSHNASAGIPALVFPDVWEAHALNEGALIDVRAPWRKMSLGWAERFPHITGIPRGYLVLSRPEQVLHKHATDQPIQFHPFTVMEYSKGPAILYDFVYATVDSQVPDYHTRVRQFFAGYKDQEERYGRYLLAADIAAADPLWEAEYTSPAQLRLAQPGAQSQLELLEERVREQTFHGKTIDELVAFLAGNYDLAGLSRLSNYVKIPPNLWSTGGTAAMSSAQLVHIALRRNKVEELIAKIVQERPQLLDEPELLDA